MARSNPQSKFARRIVPALASCLAFSIASTAIAEDWSSLRSTYDQLKNYMAAKKTIGTEERSALKDLQTKLDAYRAANPTDPRPLALDLQVATWLGDDARVDADYEALASISDEDRIQLAWARHRLAQNRYDSIPTILQASPIDLVAEPEAGLLAARAHMARNRFQDALDAIDSIPEQGLEKAGIRNRVNRTRGEASRWLALWADESALRVAEDTAGTAPVMQLITSRGPITILLFEDAAPNTVANFIELAEQDFYDGTRFHRIEPNFVAQGGDPNSRPGSGATAGTGGRGVWIPDESSRPDKRFHFAGSVAMAKSPDSSKPGSTVANSGSSQFYIVLEPAENLNQEYTVFGRVIDGMEVVEALRRDDDLLEVATISRPEKEYVAETLPQPGPVAPTAPTTTTAPGTSAETDPGTDPAEGTSDVSAVETEESAAPAADDG
ncbi:MAG: peptidylprolyl isomerase [Planctomycetota bacterium]|nr:peptidylprolyl isomerase [Planctomycetota bacterium]